MVKTKLSGLILVFFILMMGCNKEQQLPELDENLQAGLQATPIEGVYLAAVKNEQPRPPQDPANFCPAACASRTVYMAQVIYPVTICTAPDFSDWQNTAKMQPRDSVFVRIANDARISAVASKRRFGKYDRLFCKTHSGPWFAEIVDEEMCDNSCGEGSHRFSMQILGIPDDLAWVWWDAMENRPQEVQFVGEPWVTSESVKDCNLNDLTNCGQSIQKSEQSTSEKY